VQNEQKRRVGDPSLGALKFKAHHDKQAHPITRVQGGGSSRRELKTTGGKRSRKEAHQGAEVGQNRREGGERKAYQVKLLKETSVLQLPGKKYKKKNMCPEKSLLDVVQTKPQQRQSPEETLEGEGGGKRLPCQA